MDNDDRKIIEKTVDKAIKQKQKYYNCEYRINCKDGSVKWVYDCVRIFYNNIGKVDYFEGIILNITDKKNSEQQLEEYSEHLEDMVKERTKELKEAQDQLIQKEKLAVLGQLAGSIAHELRNPLGGIRNAAYYLNMELCESDNDIKESLEIIDQEVENSDKIISSLLDYARSKLPKLSKANLNEIIKTTISEVSIPENIKVVCNVSKKPIIITADSLQLRQVFQNLILNSIQAMPEGGKLEITSKTKNSKEIIVTINDTGIGIINENLEKIFEPLFTTKTRGIGFGLALSKLFVNAHNGKIEVESKVGKGSTFTIILPKNKKVEIENDKKNPNSR